MKEEILNLKEKVFENLLLKIPAYSENNE